MDQFFFDRINSPFVCVYRGGHLTCRSKEAELAGKECVPKVNSLSRGRMGRRKCPHELIIKVDSLAQRDFGQGRVLACA